MNSIIEKNVTKNGKMVPGNSDPFHESLTLNIKQCLRVINVSM